MNTSAGRLRAALTSNLTDATGTQLLVGTLDLLAVVALGFTATQIGLLNALGTISYLLLAVPLGSLVDARGPRPVLLASLATKTLLGGLALALLVTDNLTVVATMAVCLVAGIATVAAETSQTSLVAHLSDESAQISSLVARMASADRIAAIVCPALVGLAVARQAGSALLGAAVALLVVAISALLRVGGLDRPVQTADDAEPAAEPLARRLTHGFRVLAGNRVLLGVILLVTAGNIGLAIGSSVEAILVVRELELGPAFFGLLTTIGAAAGLVASLLAPRLVATRRLDRVYAVGGLAQAAVSCLPLAALLVPRAAPALMVLFSVGWAAVVTWCNIASSAYVAAAVPKESLGRTSAASRMVTMGAVPVAALGGGALADLAGLAAPLVVWPAVTLLAALLFVALSRADHRSR